MSRRKKKGTILASSFEDKALAQLKAWKGKSKFQIGYETEILPYVTESTYTPDFVLDFADGRRIYIETKGYFDYAAQVKMAAIKKQHLDKDIRIVFQKDNPIRKRSKSRYSDWATKHGYTFAVGSIPESWLL
jgi:hypothetical protein